MSSSDSSGTWNPKHRDNRPTATCTKCGGGPVRGRGLCGFHYHKLRTHLHAVGKFESYFVPIGPTREHIAGLRAAGIGWPRIAALSGIPAMTLYRLADPTRKKVGRHVAAALAEIDVPTRHRADPAHAPGARIDITGSRRRLRALARMGYSQDFLLERLGLKPGSCALSKVYSGDQHPTVTAHRARELEALFDELRHRAGPSKRARSDARRKGWPPPEAWPPGTIDDPTAEPDTNYDRMRVQRVNAKIARDRHLADVEADMRLVGRSDAQIAAALGIEESSLERRQWRRHADEAAS